MFENKSMLKIKNNAMSSFDELLTQKKVLENRMANLQREKDLKVDKVNNKYEAQIEQIIRTLKIVNTEIDKAQSYITDNMLDQDDLVIGSRRNDKKSNK